MAALIVVSSHFRFLTESADWPPFPSTQAVQRFFILSGMFTYKSFLSKSDALAFYKRRLHRILPAYVGTILFCCLIGTLFTVLPLREFLVHAQTARYLFWNLLMLGWLEPSLPGVFQDHVLSVMDGALWTMKYEMAFYALLPLLVYLLQRVSRQRRTWILVGCYALLVAIQTLFLALAYHTDQSSLHLFHKIGAPQAVCFLSGIIVCEYYQKLQSHFLQLLPLALLIGVLSFVYHPVKILWPIAFAVHIVYAGTRLPFLRFTRRWTPLTYEFYLLHFPILQAVIEAGVIQRWGTGMSYAIVLILTLVFAYLLHRLVQSRPTLRRSKLSAKAS